MAASFGFALVQLDVTVVNVALPAIARALGADVARLQWVVDAYALAFAAFLLTGGHLGDRFGAKRIYLAGMGLFAAASMGCGLAGAAATLIVMRVVQGLGAALMLPCSLALINHAAPATGGGGQRPSAGGPRQAASRSVPGQSSAVCCWAWPAGAASFSSTCPSASSVHG